MIRLSVLERNYNIMECPEGYIVAMQSDSESVNDPLYIQEEQNAPESPASPQLSGEVSSLYRRKRQRQKNNQGREDSFEAAKRLLTDKRNRITTPTPEEDDDEISRPVTETKKKYVNTTVKSIVLYGNMSSRYGQEQQVFLKSLGIFHHRHQIFSTVKANVYKPCIS